MFENDNLSFYHLDWDSDYFKINAAKAILKNTLSPDDCLNLIYLVDEYDFISISNMNSNVNNSLFLGEKTRAFIIDTNVQFEKRVIKPTTKNSKIRIMNNYSGDKNLLKLAEFNESKFLKDFKLKERGGDQVYSHWLKNSFEQEEKYFSLSYADDKEINGYVLHSFNKNICHIELIGVAKNSKGKGIGKELFQSVEYSASLKGIETIHVGTQIMNLGAINFYHKNGCKHIASHQTYHLWNIK